MNAALPWVGRALLVALAAFAGTARAQIDQPPAIPGEMETSVARSLAAERATLVDRMNALLARIRAHNGQCGQVRSDDAAAIRACQASQAGVNADIAAYQAALAAYEGRLRTAVLAPRRVYRHSGSGLIGGTGWQIGYYSPVGASEQVRARAREMVREQARAANKQYEESIDFDRYNFVIGLANSPSVAWDFTTRVWRDQFTNGQATANLQGAYNSLRDRRFDELGCHSNGAMICLAALMNRDVQAGKVILYGPQITAGSMELWNELLDDGYINSLEIMVAQNDPVPPAALLFSPTSSPNAAARRAPLLFDVDSLERTIREMSPRAIVTTFTCGTRPSPDCHGMARYAAQRRRCQAARDAGATVPGTRNPGGRRVAEPPPPNCR